MLGSFGFFSAGDRDCRHRIKNHNMISRINDFMRTPGYVMLLGLLTAVSNALSLDLYLYTLFIVIGIYVSVFGIDFLPLMPIVILCYVAPSIENNPGRYPDSIFYPENGGIYLIVLAALLLVSIVVRVVRDPEFGGMKFLKARRLLTGGMLALGATYLLSGLGMEDYGEVAANNLLFAVIQFAAVFVMYFFFCGAVKWERTPKDYFACIGLCVGYVVFFQLLGNYLVGRVFVNSAIDREKIVTGWGMHNNVGGMMAMMLPFSFYLAYRRTYGWLYNIFGTILFAGVVLSCSRTSMFVAAVAYILCAVILLKDPASRKYNLLVYLVAAVALVVLVVLFGDQLLQMFQVFLNNIFMLSSRDAVYDNGLKQFFAFPIFGGSFYPRTEYVPWDWANLEAFSSFFPPRWHNTLIQIGASCGAVGLAAYGFHRVQTIKLLLTARSKEKTFIAIFIGVLLATSLLDCHFFNVGPVLFYSMALAFAEKCQTDEN